MNAPRIRHYPAEPWQLLDADTREPCARFTCRRLARAARSTDGGHVVHTFASGRAEPDDGHRITPRRGVL